MPNKAIFRNKEYQTMIDDTIEDVHDAVRWLREHGVQVNDNKQGVNSYEKKVVKKEKEVEYGYTSGH